MNLCDPCWAEWAAWNSYKMPPAPIALISIGNRPRDIADRKQARLDDWRDTIRRQHTLIRRACQAGHQTARRAA